MGDPKKARKQYTRPRKRWDKARIDEERSLISTYGLRKKKEIRLIETKLRKKRQAARQLLALDNERRGRKERELLRSLQKMGLLGEKATLDDVLSLSLPQLMERRLQTIVWRKDFAKTVKQSRQFITHGHIAIKGQKVDCPNYLVDVADEGEIAYFKKPLQLVPKVVEKKDVARDFAQVSPEGEAAAAEKPNEDVVEAKEESKGEVKEEAPKEEVKEEETVEEKTEEAKEAATEEKKGEASSVEEVKEEKAEEAPVEEKKEEAKEGGRNNE